MTTQNLSRSLLILAVVSFSAARPARAQLTWKQRTIEIKADPSQAMVEAHFAFTNSGAKAVDVRNIESSCGCTTANLEQRHYEPGQGGEIVAQFTLGNHSGRQEKTIAVKTSDQEDMTVLTLVTEIPEIVHFQPAFVTWAKGEEKKPKTVIVEAAPDVTLREVELKASNPAMTAELAPLVKGHKYQITVTPTTTEHFVFSTLNLDCQFGKDITRSFHTYATVKPTAD